MPTYDFVDFDEQPALVRSEICLHKDLGPTISRILGEMTEANPDAELVAPPMVVYTDWQENSCSIEVALPVEATTEAGYPSKLKVYPACTAVHVTHTGSYDGLMQAWSDFLKEIETDNVQVGGHPWDSYAVGPDDDPNPANWVTDLYVPMPLLQAESPAA